MENENNTVEISTWKPHYEELVALYYSGRSIHYISEQSGLDSRTIKRIIRSKQGIAIKNRIIQEVNKRSAGEVPKRIQDCVNGAVEVLEHAFIKRRAEFIERAPLAMLEKSFKLLQGTGHLKSPTENVVNTNISLSAEVQNQIVKAMEFSKVASDKND